MWNLLDFSKKILTKDYLEVKSAVFWRKVILVPKVILRYEGLKVFFSLDPKKGPKEGL